MPECEQGWSKRGVWQITKVDDIANKDAKSYRGCAHPLDKTVHTSIPMFIEKHMPSIFQGTRGTMANGKQVCPCHFRTWMHILKGRAVSREAQDRGGAGRKDMFLPCHICATDHRGSQQGLLLPTGNREDWTLRHYCEEQVRRKGTGVFCI